MDANFGRGTIQTSPEAKGKLHHCARANSIPVGHSNGVELDLASFGF